jgi:hypothetical protein
MPEPRKLKSEIIAVLVLATLNIAMLAKTASGKPAGHAYAGGGDGKNNAATSAHSTDSAKDASKTPPTDPGSAPAANAALVDELQQLRDAVNAQAQRLIEHAQ